MKQLINILIRTSDRPNYFARCLNSVLQQTYKNYRVIVSADNNKTKAYVNIYGLQCINVKSMPRTQEQTAPWNLYLNDLMDQVDDGWIIFLDDDDYLADENVLENIAKQLDNKYKLYVWQMQWPNGRKIPEDTYFHKPFERKHIGMPCFTFHSVIKDKIRFDAMRAGDFRVISELEKYTDKINWIRQVYVKIGNTGLVGKKVDLSRSDVIEMK